MACLPSNVEGLSVEKLRHGSAFLGCSTGIHGINHKSRKDVGTVVLECDALVGILKERGGIRKNGTIATVQGLMSFGESRTLLYLHLNEDTTYPS